MKNLEFDKKKLYNYWFFQNLIDESQAKGGVDLGEMPKYTKYCTYIVYRLWYGYGVTNLIIFSKSKLPFYLMKQILSQIFLKKKTTTFSLQSTFLKVLSYLGIYLCAF